MKALRKRAVVLVLAAGALAALPAEAQTTDAAALGALLPEAPANWSSTDGDVVDQNVGGMDLAQVSRTYTAGGMTVALTYIGSPSMVAAARGAGMMFRNRSMVDQMNANDPDKQFDIIEEEGWAGWTVVNHADMESEATAFNEHLVVKIEIDDADDFALALFLDQVPWADLAALHE